MTHGRTGRAAWLALCVCLSAPAAPAWAQCPDGTPPPCAVARRAAARRPPPALAQRRKNFLVLPFRNVSRSAEYNWLVEGSPVLITDALSRHEDLSVVPDERLYPALQRAGLAPGGVMDLARVRRVADETGGWTAVTGEILELGGRLRVSARAFDVVTNAEVLRAVEEAGAGEDVRAVYQRLGTRLMRAAGVQEGAAADLAATTTGSVDAYRAYVRGIVHANRSEPRSARDAFLEAIRLDSGYAQAYMRLAEAESGINPGQIADPRSPLYRWAARAAELAGGLPPHDRDLVLAINDLLSARLASARERLERLLRQDSLDVDALEWRVSVELMDAVLVPSGAGERPRGSINAALRIAKRTLELDPSRHQVYGGLVQVYLISAGGAPGFRLAYRTAPPSLPAFSTTPPDRIFIPLLRDSLELVPAESLAATVPRDSLAAARRRALDAAAQWARHWIAAGPNEAEAHLWMSRVHALGGEYAAALAELQTADSLGVETGLENVPARRMALLARLERYAEGTRVADSLWDARALDIATINAYQIEGVSWAWMLFALEGRYDRAAALFERLAAVLAPARMSNPQLSTDGLAYLLLAGQVETYFLAPAPVRLRLFGHLLDDATGLPPPLARMLPLHADVLLSDTATPDRPALAARIAARADRLAADHAGLAYPLALVAAGADSVAGRAVAAPPWYVARRDSAEAERLATLRRFRPLGVTVTDSTATFRWAVAGDAPFRWNRVETPLGGDDFNWRAEFPAAGSRFEVRADVGGRPGTTPASGTLAQLLAAATRSLREVVSPDTALPRRVVPRAVVRAEPDAGGFRLVLREPRVVAALRAERPATLRMRFTPCARPPGAARECVDAEVPITYP